MMYSKKRQDKFMKSWRLEVITACCIWKSFVYLPVSFYGEAIGISCNFYMGPTEIQGVLFMVVEYNDYAWMYFVVPEK